MIQPTPGRTIDDPKTHKVWLLAHRIAYIACDHGPAGRAGGYPAPPGLCGGPRRRGGRRKSVPGVGQLREGQKDEDYI